MVALLLAAALMSDRQISPQQFAHMLSWDVVNPATPVLDSIHSVPLLANSPSITVRESLKVYKPSKNRLKVYKSSFNHYFILL